MLIKFLLKKFHFRSTIQQVCLMKNQLVRPSLTFRNFLMETSLKLSTQNTPCFKKSNPKPLNFDCQACRIYQLCFSKIQIILISLKFQWLICSKRQLQLILKRSCSALKFGWRRGRTGERIKLKMRWKADTSTENLILKK